MGNSLSECIAENLMRAIEHLNPEDIGVAGRRFVAENFVFEKVAVKCEEVLQDVE